MSTNRLRLGRLPKAESVRISVAIPVELRWRVKLHAHLHSQAHGEPFVAVGLILHMLDASISRDSQFLERSRNIAMMPASPLGAVVASGC
jgi:hypothetical protein